MPSLGYQIVFNQIVFTKPYNPNVAQARKNITPMKSCFTDNSMVYYKRGSSTGVGTVRNGRAKSQNT
jgi:hypothetical protein